MKKLIVAVVVVVACVFTTLSVISKSTDAKTVSNQIKIDKADFATKTGFGKPKNDLVAID